MAQMARWTIHGNLAHLLIIKRLIVIKLAGQSSENVHWVLVSGNVLLNLSEMGIFSGHLALLATMPEDGFGIFRLDICPARRCL